MSQISPVSSPSGRPAMSWHRRTIYRIAGATGHVVRHKAFHRLLFATPSLLVALGTFAAIPMLQADPGEIRRLYESVATRALQKKDTTTAGICLDRLTRLKTQAGFVSSDFVYMLTKLSFDLGQNERAEVLLEELAPEDRPVHAPAHLTRAILLLRRSEASKEATNASRLRAERHLRHALSLDPDMAVAHEILGQIALHNGDLARAEKHLQIAAKVNPALSYQVALVMQRQGQPQSAAIWARQARDYYSRTSEKDPDNHGARIFWASSEMFLGNHESTRKILGLGLARVNLREFHQLLANSYLLEAETLSKEGESNQGRRLILLEKALQHDPNSPALVEQISRILKKGGSEAEQLRVQLQALLAEGKALTTAHLLLGYDDWEHGKPEQARLHWERALESNPKSTVVANNLAWALASGPNPDLPRALNLVNLVIELNPREPTLFGTRGRILARLERWKEALSSLEAALPASGESRDLHADLATVYAALKLPDLAEKHQRLANAPLK